LEWPAVRTMSKYIFQKTETNINIYSKSKLMVDEKQQIIREYHVHFLGGHRGLNQTIKRIQSQFDWEGLNQDIIEFINKCASCQTNKISNRNTKQPMVISTTASEPFERVFIDVVGPFTCSYNGNVCILTLQCDLTKCSVAIPMANKEAITVAYHFVTLYFCMHGMP